MINYLQLSLDQLIVPTPIEGTIMFPILVVSAVVFLSRNSDLPVFTEEALGGGDNSNDDDVVTYKVTRNAVVFVKFIVKINIFDARYIF